MGNSEWGCPFFIHDPDIARETLYYYRFVSHLKCLLKRMIDGTGDFARLKKKSFYWYKDVIASNGEKL